MKQNLHKGEQHWLLPNTLKPGLWWSQGSEPKPPDWIKCLTHKTLYSHWLFSHCCPHLCPHTALNCILMNLKNSTQMGLKRSVSPLPCTHSSSPQSSSAFPLELPTPFCSSPPTAVSYFLSPVPFLQQCFFSFLFLSQWPYRCLLHPCHNSFSTFCLFPVLPFPLSLCLVFCNPFFPFNQVPFTG